MFAQNAPLGAIKGDSVKHPQGVRRDIGANPLDDVAVVIVMGRFDEIEVKRLALSARPFPRRHAASSPTFWGTLDRLSAQRGWRHLRRTTNGAALVTTITRQSQRNLRFRRRIQFFKSRPRPSSTHLVSVMLRQSQGGAKGASVAGA